MRMGSNRRLANIKTRSETGLDYVMQNIDLNTPFGKKQLKEIKPFFPGEEDELRAELDKLESISGMKIEIEMDQFIQQVNDIKLAIIGQTGNLAPADKYLYALRDVTGTVESIPLIASSISAFDSKAASLPISGLAPAPSPLVSFSPI